MKINKKPIIPNKNNKPTLSAAKAAAATASITNFIKGIKMPPTTATARAEMQAASTAFKVEEQKAKAQAARNAVGKTAATPAAQLAAQQTVIGTQLPSIANFLPPAVKPANVTFSAAIQSMQDTIAQLDVLIANPVAELGGGAEYGRGAFTTEK
jgi:hypothetical protein